MYESFCSHIISDFTAMFQNNYSILRHLYCRTLCFIEELIVNSYNEHFAFKKQTKKTR